MDDATARAAALLAAALSHLGHGLPAADLTADADWFTGWITGRRAALATLTLKGDPMPLSIDSIGAKAVLLFTDRLGDPVAPPDGTLALATSSDTGVLTVGAAVPGTDPGSGAATIEFPLAEMSAGTSTLTVHATNADGSPLLGPDAVTPITDAAPVDVTVNPGAPAAERFTVPGA